MLQNDVFWSEISHFKKNEFVCGCGCGLNIISHPLVEKLEKARTIARIPFSINCGCRCKQHNLAVGGSVTSSHIKGYAVDIHVANSNDRFIIIEALMTVGFKRLGVYKNFIHCDNDNDKIQNVIWYK